MNDIGLIKLDKDIVFGDKVKPIPLPTKNFDKFNYPATLSGWGTTNVNTKDLSIAMCCIKIAASHMYKLMRIYAYK